MTASRTPLRNFTLRLTDAERSELERRAGELAVGSYIKAVLFAGGGERRRGARRPVKDHAALAQVLACLGQSRLGESLDRLSRAAESGTLFIDDDVLVAIKRACEDIAVIRLLLMRSLGFRLPEELPSESLSQSFARAVRPDPDSEGGRS